MAVSEEFITKLGMLVIATQEPKIDGDVLELALELAVLGDQDDEERYDFNRAQSFIWLRRAMLVAGGYDFKVEGKEFNRDQVYQHYIDLSSRFAKKSLPQSIRLTHRHCHRLREDLLAYTYEGRDEDGMLFDLPVL